MTPDGQEDTQGFLLRFFYGKIKACRNTDLRARNRVLCQPGQDSRDTALLKRRFLPECGQILLTVEVLLASLKD